MYLTHFIPILNQILSFLHVNQVFVKRFMCFTITCLTHNIFSNFDANPPRETRGVFLDICKAFDRVWLEGLLHKLKSYGVSGPFLSLIKSFLENRMQRVVLNGQTSSWKHVLAGVPQGSILGPLFFLVYINDIPDGLQSIVKIFAVDTPLYLKSCLIILYHLLC